MPTLAYFVVDVFTKVPLAGNPLAVVFDTIGLSHEQMLAIAREFNLSETTYVKRRPAGEETSTGVRVRIFTTEEELPFAGHPTLGTASILKLHAPETLQGDTVTLDLNVGPVPVRFDTGGSPGLSGEMTQRDPVFGEELDPSAVARLIGLQPDDLDSALTPQLVSTGNAFAIVVLRSVEALSRLRVHQEEASRWLRERGGRWFYVMAPAGGDAPYFRARMQFNGGEDPATGSAAGCAISYLVARGVVPSGRRIHVQQGVEMGRPSDLFLSATRDGAKVIDVRVAGSTVPVATGHLFLP
ncbi:MAG TPA: PhzF family phenazine biosynthesis protein [Terracidiphilus sp.]|nr:PhzF family phenazine biosynthesis protein [Terracidiphilus sp.]